MRHFQEIRSPWVCIFLITLVCQSAHSSINYEKPLSLEITNLTRWKNSFMAPAIQQALGAMIRPRFDSPRAPAALEGLKKYAFLYSKPFLVLEAERNPFGGFWGTVVFEDHPQVLGLWIFELGQGSNIWELREVLPFRIKMPKTIKEQLVDKRVNPFWIKASITW